MDSGLLERREFLAGLAGAPLLAASDGVLYRKLGRTGEKVSAIGLGGWHIGAPKDENEGIRIVRTALDRGVNFLDNCWSYHNGGSEIRMGKALRDGYRHKAFLMTKFEGRTKQAAAKQIDESLQRLQTDHVDLIQLHENIRMEDGDRYFAPGGAHEAVTEAKKAGKVRYIGFTGHKDPAVHLRMLEVAEQNSFRFDACQLPLNVLDAHFRSFERQVVPKLVKEGIAVLGMKPMAFGAILKAGAATAMECLQYALSLPASVVITGCESMERLEQAFEAMRTFQPMNRSQIAALLTKTKEFALTGKYELFKTTANFDATARHPEWL